MADKIPTTSLELQLARTFACFVHLAPVSPSERLRLFARYVLLHANMLDEAPFNPQTDPQPEPIQPNHLPQTVPQPELEPQQAQPQPEPVPAAQPQPVVQQVPAAEPVPAAQPVVQQPQGYQPYQAQQPTQPQTTAPFQPTTQAPPTLNQQPQPVQANQLPLFGFPPQQPIFRMPQPTAPPVLPQTHFTNQNIGTGYTHRQLPTTYRKCDACHQGLAVQRANKGYFQVCESCKFTYPPQ